MTLIFISENQILAAGHDCTPFAFANKNNTWMLVDKLDTGVKKSPSSQQNTAFNKFKQMDSKSISTASADTELTTVHQNTISFVFFIFLFFIFYFQNILALYVSLQALVIKSRKRLLLALMVNWSFGI